MNRRLLALCAILSVSLLTGCAGQLRQSAYGAVTADAITTLAGVASGAAQEGNPLITSPAGLLASVALRIGAVEYINTLPEPQRTENLSVINSITWGAAASNLTILAMHSNPAGIVAGLAVGWRVWQSTAEERAFAGICADEKTRNPALICTYKNKETL